MMLVVGGRRSSRMDGELTRRMASPMMKTRFWSAIVMGDVIKK